MKKNIGPTDRLLRVALAIVFLLLFLTGTVSGIAGIVLLVFGGVFALTSAIRVCPLYLPFGISTIRGKMTDKRSQPMG